MSLSAVLSKPKAVLLIGRVDECNKTSETATAGAYSVAPGHTVPIGKTGLRPATFQPLTQA